MPEVFYKTVYLGREAQGMFYDFIFQTRHSIVLVLYSLAKFIDVTLYFFHQPVDLLCVHLELCNFRHSLGRDSQ